MGKAYGMIACTTLIAAGLWIANVGDSPAEAVAGVETPGTSPGYSTRGTTPGTAPVAGYSSVADRTVTHASIVRAQSPETTDSQFGSESGPVPFDSPEKRNAVQLLKSARKELAAGRFDIARQKAREAQQLKAKYAVFEDNPQHVLNEIERRSGGIIFTPQQNTVVTADSVADADAPSRVQPAGFEDPAANPKEEALGLLREARQAMRAGHYASAREKALKAQSFDVAYGLFEDNPELLIEDLTRLASQAPVATPSAGTSEKAVALNLVKEARKALYSGQYDDAYQKAVAAQQFEVTYDLLEDRPEAVLNELQTVMAGQSARKTETIAASPVPKPAAPSFASAASPDTARAREMVKQARAALDAGRVEEAWAKATAASQMNVAFQLFEDSPEQIMTAIEKMQQPTATPNAMVAQAGATRSDNSSSANSNPSAQAAQLVREARTALKNGQFETAKQKAMLADQMNATYGAVDDRPELVLQDLARIKANPFDEPTAQDSYPVANANITPVYPATMSARDLYDSGLSQMRNGNMSAAREAFLMAYRQEDQLDARRRQQLQDFLRELAPRGNAAVQLTSGQSYDDAQPGQLDLVEQQRAIQYDRLRSEVMNSIFRAERLREKDPDQALSVLDQALANIENSDLAEDAAKNLVNSIRRTQTAVNSYKEQQAPLLDLKRQNAETLDSVKSRINTKIRIEQEFAKMVEEYNSLMEERRYAEAEVIAKQAVELAPEFPEAELMKWKAKYARRHDSNEKLRDEKEENYWNVMNDVERSILNPVHTNPISYDVERWKDIQDRPGKYGGPTNHVPTETERKIHESLSRQISLHFDNAPLTEVMKHIANMMGITVYVDSPALGEVGVESNTTISIDVDGIMLKSALNLILTPMELGYNIEDEVLKITNRLRMQGKLVTHSYPVADLVVPLSNMAPKMQQMLPFGGSGQGGYVANSGAGFNLGGVNGFMQVDDDGALPGMMNSPFPGGGSAQNQPRTTTVNFDELSDLITTTVEPDSWTEFSGAGSLMSNHSTLSLVIRQTQGVHDQVADLLEQLRRLQDLQVTIEVRFITVADEFFERIGVDFDFNVQDTIAGEEADLPPFGTPDSGAANNQGGNNQGGNNQGMTSNAFTPLNPALTPQDVWGNPSIVGLSDQNGNFTNDLDIGFRQGSFDLGVPEFVNTDLSAGASMGFAILSDIEAFFFINAAQGDSRSNIMFAPKVTLFNGQTASVQDNVQRPFVTGFRPIVGVGSVGFEPIIQVIPDGVQMGVAAVVSADRRYVRLSVSPIFTTITDIETFSVPGGSVGNFGGVNIGNQGGNNQGGNNQGQNNQGQNNQGGSAGSFTIQQPIVEFVTVQTTVSVPDGGTVLLGGVKRMQEGRNMAGVPILNKLPYVSRLFKNTGVGRNAESLMLMVTPRIIIQEEEEELLGIPQ